MRRRERRPPDDAALDAAAIRAFVAERGGRVNAREIGRAFGLKGRARAEAAALAAGGDPSPSSERRRGASRAPKAGDADRRVVEVVGLDREGVALTRPDVEAGASAPDAAPALLRVRVESSGPREARVEVGDRLLVRVLPTEDGRAPAAKLVRTLSRSRDRKLGIFQARSGGGGRVSPIDKRDASESFEIPADAAADARDGELVALELVRAGRFGKPRARVVERLGEAVTEAAISQIALLAHRIPHVFPPEVVAEAEAARAATAAGREDWRDVPFVTIDPADAKDHDDAVHARPDDDPKNPGGFVLSVAIADVSAYVLPGTALDREAELRGNSVYFPDRVVPMLPERLSNDLCSLKPDVDRPALAVRVPVFADGRHGTPRFQRVTIRSRAKLSYPQAQAAVDGRTDDTTAPLAEPVLRPLWAAYRVLAAARDARGPLALDLPERKILLTPDGRVDRVVTPERLDAHKLIEEFMILANVCAAEALEKAKSPLIYRAHDEPALAKMEGLREVMETLGVKIPRAGALSPTLFNRLLARFRGTPNELFVNDVVLRSQAQAEYVSENYGHFGLALRRYAHFTSPIRRYADLVVHRALVSALGLGDGGLPRGVTRASLSDVATRISVAERRAMAAERETVDRLIAHHLADRVGATFEGRVAGVTRAGLFVSLNDTGASGFVPAATLPGDEYWRFEPARHALVGSRSGRSLRLGDPVVARLVEAAPVAGALRFELANLTGDAGDANGREPRGRRPRAAEGRATRGRRRAF